MKGPVILVRMIRGRSIERRLCTVEALKGKLLLMMTKASPSSVQVSQRVDTQVESWAPGGGSI